MPSETDTGLDWVGKTHPALSLKEAVDKLRAGESTVNLPLKGKDSASRYDVLKLESTSPSQDRLTYERVNLGEGQDWQFWGIYDGHAGWATAEVLRRSLISYVVREFKDLTSDSLSKTEDITSAIKKAFVRLDDEIISNGLEAIRSSNDHATILSHLAPAVAGSCALLAIYNTNTCALHVACTGDSRAVLGRYVSGSSDKWTAIALSEDQNPANESECERVRAAHPDEPNMLAKGKLLGLPLTRAFGDHRWKWPVDAVSIGCPKYYAHPPRPNTVSPPYLTAEPVIQSTVTQSGDFLMLATDGIWDNMSSSNAVLCMEQWLNETRRRATAGEEGLGAISDAYADSTITEGMGKPMTPMAESWGWEAMPKDFVVEDSNAATHLAKNALGGNRREQFRSVMSTHPPESRDARDDLSVQVVLFGDIL